MGKEGGRRMIRWVKKKYEEWENKRLRKRMENNLFPIVEALANNTFVPEEHGYTTIVIGEQE